MEAILSGADYDKKKFVVEVPDYREDKTLLGLKETMEVTQTELGKTIAALSDLRQELEKTQAEISAIEQGCFEKSGTRAEYEKAVASDKTLQELKKKSSDLEFTERRKQAEIENKNAEIASLSTQIVEAETEAKGRQEVALSRVVKKSLREMVEALQAAQQAATRMREVVLSRSLTPSPAFELPREIEPESLRKLVELAVWRLSIFQ